MNSAPLFQCAKSIPVSRDVYTTQKSKNHVGHRNSEGIINRNFSIIALFYNLDFANLKHLGGLLGTLGEENQGCESELFLNSKCHELLYVRRKIP